jgi:hypothetical protein
VEQRRPTRAAISGAPFGDDRIHAVPTANQPEVADPESRSLREIGFTLDLPGPVLADVSRD